ncbi:MAG: hypothetical protein HZA19_04480 [Nitrospirae bacterium]|nr:hypothetical protein [Nitrospirota bacterium]
MDFLARFLFIAFFVISSIVFGEVKWVHAAEGVVFQIGERTWFNTGTIEWNIGGPGGAPNILSELKFQDIDYTAAEVHGSFDLHSRHLWFFALGLGGVRDGRFIDNDYNGNDRTDLYSSMEGRVDGTRMQYIQADYALRFSGFAKRGSQWNRFADLVIGYRLNEEKMAMTDGYQTLGTAGPVWGLNSSYRFQWESYGMGVRGGFSTAERWSIEGGVFVIPWTRYRGEGVWNLRTDMKQNPSFKHESDDGWGEQVDVTVSYKLGDRVAFEAGYRYLEMVAKKGVDTTFGSDGTVITIPLNEVMGRKNGVFFGIRYAF